MPFWASAPHFSLKPAVFSERLSAGDYLRATISGPESVCDLAVSARSVGRAAAGEIEGEGGGEARFR